MPNHEAPHADPMHMQTPRKRNARIRTVCVEDPSAQPEALEYEVQELVLALHGRHGTKCLASCAGHPWALWRLSPEPYVYFNSSASIAELLHAVFEQARADGLLSRAWGIRGLMHPDYGLSFLIAPTESRPAFGARRNNVADLKCLALLVKQTLDKAVKERRKFPPPDPNAYGDHRQNAEALIAPLIERIRVPAFRARRSGLHAAAEQRFAFFARLKRHFLPRKY